MQWRDANTLFDLAEYGVTNTADDYRFSNQVDSIILTDICEIIPCSDKAIKNIEGATELAVKTLDEKQMLKKLMAAEQIINAFEHCISDECDNCPSLCDEDRVCLTPDINKQLLSIVKHQKAEIERLLQKQSKKFCFNWAKGS